MSVNFFVLKKVLQTGKVLRSATNDRGSAIIDRASAILDRRKKGLPEEKIRVWISDRPYTLY